jgi:hypothetical protein
LLSLPKANSSPVDRQKWINSINDHIYYGTNFMKQGMRFDDSDEDELTDLMPIGSMQAMIQTANAHQSILEKHIKALLQLTDDINAEKQLNSSVDNCVSDNSVSNNIIESSLPSLKFHLNLILESSNNANSALSHCMAVLTHQDDVSRHKF